jgi:hypothetical protein
MSTSAVVDGGMAGSSKVVAVATTSVRAAVFRTAGAAAPVRLE